MVEDKKAAAETTKEQQPKEKTLLKHTGSSRAVLTKRVVLHSSPAQRILERSFETVSNRLYDISVMIPLLTNDEIAEKVEQITISAFEEVESTIENKIAQLEELMNQNEIEANIQFTSSKTYSCELTTRYAARYLRLVLRYQDLVTMLEALWLNEFLDNTQRNRGIFSYQRRVGKLMGKLIHIDNNLKKLKEVGAEGGAEIIQRLLAVPDEAAEPDPKGSKKAITEVTEDSETQAA